MYAFLVFCSLLFNPIFIFISYQLQIVKHEFSHEMFTVISLISELEEKSRTFSKLVATFSLLENNNEKDN